MSACVNLPEPPINVMPPTSFSPPEVSEWISNLQAIYLFKLQINVMPALQRPLLHLLEGRNLQVKPE
jgi:hypothetical protein